MVDLELVEDTLTRLGNATRGQLFSIVDQETGTVHRSIFHPTELVSKRNRQTTTVANLSWLEDWLNARGQRTARSLIGRLWAGDVCVWESEQGYHSSKTKRVFSWKEKDEFIKHIIENTKST